MIRSFICAFDRSAARAAGVMRATTRDHCSHVFSACVQGLIAKRALGKEIRSVSFNNQGSLIAVGFIDGQISLLKFTLDNRQLSDMFKTRERNASIIGLR
jgi:hypothetical protein